MVTSENVISKKSRVCQECGKETLHEVNTAQISAKLKKKERVVKTRCLECGHITRMPND